MRALLIAAALLLAAPAAASAEDVVIDGRGWGHGIGLSQYGAHGYALRDGRDHEWILGHFYTGTTVGRAPAARMRVLLQRASAPRVCGATRLRDAAGRSIRLSDRRTYRFRSRGSGIAMSARTQTTSSSGTGRVLRAPLTITGGATTCLRGRADNDVSDGSYRGRMVLARESGGAVLAINHVLLEHYLYGVVPAEMPSSWPAEALRAQAVVARSYALRSRRTGSFDVYADVRSQVYRGLAGEAATTTAAVRATRAKVVLAGGDVAQTFFFSTSGGRTAAVEEEWGGEPISYLRSVDDPHDDLSPYHTWRSRLTERQVRRALSGLVSGRFRGLSVASRTASDRAATVDIEGSSGTNTVPAATIRTRLGLRSTWFTIR
jgi:stage II sporulation protein D